MPVTGTPDHGEKIMLAKITENPFFNLVAGMILIITAGYECIDTLGEFKLGVHHGVAVFGLFQVLKSFPEMFHGAKELKDCEDLCKAHHEN